MGFMFYEILHWGPPLEVLWGPPLETMRRPPLEGQSAVKCHTQRKVPQLQNMYFIERKYERLKATERDFYEFVYSISKRL